MGFIKQVPFFHLKTLVISGVTVLSLLGVNGCSQNTPFATVDP